MQTLCQWDVQHDESGAASSAVADAVQASPQLMAHAAELAGAFWKDRTSIDGRIAAAAQHWDLQRISLVDRNVLRVAVTEMFSGEVPRKVALDEAIEIVKEYGGADSPRFVNGVLDAVLRKMEGEVAQPHAAPRQSPPTSGGATSGEGSS